MLPHKAFEVKRHQERGCLQKAKTPAKAHSLGSDFALLALTGRSHIWKWARFVSGNAELTVPREARAFAYLHKPASPRVFLSLAHVPVPNPLFLHPKPLNMEGQSEWRADVVVGVDFGTTGTSRYSLLRFLCGADAKKGC